MAPYWFNRFWFLLWKQLKKRRCNKSEFEDKKMGPGFVSDLGAGFVYRAGVLDGAAKGNGFKWLQSRF